MVLNVLNVLGDDEKKEMDLSQMIQMGITLGKTFLGEKAVEELQRGEFSELIKIGEKVFGKDRVKDIINTITDAAATEDDNGAVEKKEENRIAKNEETSSSVNALNEQVSIPK